MKNVFDTTGMNTDLRLMTWEVNPKKRNATDNEISFNVKKGLSVSVGTVIRGNRQTLDINKISTWKVTEIKNRRDATLSGYDNITALASWSYENL